MKKIFAMIIPGLLLMACASIEQTQKPTLDDGGLPSIQCTPDREGRFVAGEDGMLFNVPFHGSLHLRFLDNIVKPAMYASIALADEPCPRGMPQPLKIGRHGEFETAYSLLTDTHFYCIGGKLDKRESIQTIRLKIKVSGCDDIDVNFSSKSGPMQIETHCAVFSKKYKWPILPKPAPENIGTRVDIRGSDVYIHSVKMSLPFKISELEELLGKASEIIRAAGDQYSNDVYEWESNGIFAFRKPGESTVQSLGLLLDPKSNDRHWCNPGIVLLSVNGVIINQNSSISKLKNAGFQKGELWWEQRNKAIRIILQDIGDPIVHKGVEVDIN